jgi:hypothetical protein
VTHDELYRLLVRINQNMMPFNYLILTQPLRPSLWDLRMDWLISLSEEDM